MTEVISNFVGLLALVLTFLILARVLVSWTQPTGGGGFTAFIYQVTEPILAPIRRVIPPTGAIDWAPMIAILLLGILTRAFLR
ncbi:MAG TPA: YggT family protein [Candidatus Dormibacteraeota bacterium]|jgi:YggT family protein|nr:YggT family protein [Candidatus Dormibacteraeota bacterium]